MLDFSIDFNNKAVQDELGRLQNYLDDWRPALIDVGVYMLRSIDLNYLKQGRMDGAEGTWKQSKAAIKRSGQTLMNKGNLMRSTQISGNQTKPSSPDSYYNLQKKDLTIGTRVKSQPETGTGVEYYKYLHETWPAIMFQKEDYVNILQILKMYVEGKL